MQNPLLIREARTEKSKEVFNSSPRHTGTTQYAAIAQSNPEVTKEGRRILKGTVA